MCGEGRVGGGTDRHTHMCTHSHTQDKESKENTGGGREIKSQISGQIRRLHTFMAKGEKELEITLPFLSGCGRCYSQNKEFCL